MLVVVFPDNSISIYWMNEVFEDTFGNLPVIKGTNLDPRGLVARDPLESN